MGAAPATTAEALSTASAPGMPGQTDPDRRQRSSVVRGTDASLHAAGVCGRCDEPADDAALHADRSIFSCFEATRVYIECHGKPVGFYSDKYSVFRSATAGKTGSGVTQFGRAMYELNLDTFCANSSSAKGRVERAHLTLQDRLAKGCVARGQYVGRCLRLRALFHGRSHRPLSEAAEERLQCAPTVARR